MSWRSRLTHNIALQEKSFNALLVVGRDIDEKREQAALIFGLTIDGPHDETTAVLFIRGSPEAMRKLGNDLEKERR